MREFSALSAMDAILPGEGVPIWGAVDAMRQLYDAIGPDMPDDLKTTTVTADLPNNPTVTKYNYDEGHAGRMSVPDTQGGSMSFPWVLDQPKFKKYILENLSFRPKVGPASSYSPEDELIVFVPGLNTLHEPEEGESTTVERLKHYVNVLNVPISQLHIGTSFDQGDVHVDSSRAPMLNALLSTGSFLPGSVQPNKENKGELIWDARQIDRLQVGLSQQNAIDTPIKEQMRALLETTAKPDGPEFVLMVYSRGAMEAEAALRKHVEESRGKDEEIQKRLRDRVTVVTVGSATHDFPDGPKYIHLSAWTDPLTSVSGVSPKINTEGAGKDALFVNCNSPYNETSFDNHNFGAVTSQYLACMMKANEVKTLAELWEKGNKGEVVQPGDDILRAMIQMTKGWNWLWNTESAWKDIPMGALPSTNDAFEKLKAEYGEGFARRLADTFGMD